MRTEQQIAWIDKKTKEARPAPFGDWITDLATVDYIAPLLSGFMENAVRTMDGQDVEARSFAAKSVDEIFTAFSDRAVNEKLYLLDLVYIPALPKYHYIDAETFETKTLPKPVIDGGHMWKIRIGALPK